MKLNQIIQQQIQSSNNWIPFAKFMEMALYTPKIGYYNNLKFSADFVTAPEISSLFGQTIAQTIMPTKPANILEFGAGSGKMAIDILLAFNNLSGKYYIVEVSPNLRHQQQRNIKKHAPELLKKVKWLNQMPENFEGVILLNELIDAIPANRFIVEDNQIFSLGVSINSQDKFCFKKNEQISLSLPELPNGYVSEYRPLAKKFVQSVARNFKSGLMLIIDYGYEAYEYYHPERVNGTLTCFKNHQQNHNPFINIGRQDISVHVDFSQLAQTAVDCGLTINNMQTQANFLLENGIVELAQQKDLNNTIIRLKTSSEIQKLTMPGQMGELIKVLTLSA